MRLIVITSPATDAGKTFLAAGIAEAAAVRGLKTLFMEMDMTVGDAVRVFGLAEAARVPHPTVATWNEYPDLAAACLKTPSGVCVLPRPELMPETVSAESVESLLSAVKNNFDVVVADLGVDCYVDCWPVMVRSADVAILVSDCDEKALVRVKRFLTSCCPASPPGKWVLAVNAREKKGAYSPRDVERFLAGAAEIGGVARIPYFPGAEKNPVKTFPPDDRFAEDILKVVMENGGGVLKEEELEKAKKTEYPGMLEPEPARTVARSGRPSLLARLFSRSRGKSGINVNGGYIEGNWKAPAKMLDEKCDAVTPVIRNYGHDEPCEFSQNDKTDALTGLLTRKALQETELPKKYGLLFCDLDKFKTVNDTYGHNVGDRILEEFGATLMQMLREIDIAARWGGDEFVLVLPGADRKAAERIAEQIQFRWAANLLAQKYNVGVSIGVDESRQGTTFEKVVAGADANMYQRKKKRTGAKPRLYFTCCSGGDTVRFRKLGGCILIDADPEMKLSRSLANSESLWQSDWRLGLNAEPLLLPYKIRFYGLSPELGPLDARDYEAFNDFVMVALTKGRVVINVGSDEEIEAKLSTLGAVPLEGVYNA